MKMRKHWLMLSAGVLMVMAMTIAACTTMSEQRASTLKLPVPVQGAQYVGSETCADCHEELVASFSGSIHDRILAKETAIGMKGCETCHGPASVHADSEDPSKIIRFEGMDPGMASAVCLRCHSDGEQMDWAGTSHPMNDISCLNCHKIHNPPVAENSLEKPEPDLCYECHAQERAQMYYPSHHPVKEGKMTCSDCHANHGSMVNNLKTDERINDLCLNCHARFQGPFVFEHSPVSDDCMICHNPHGTVADNLLKTNEPYLCLQCHEPHFHAGRTSTGNVPMKDPYGNIIQPSQYNSGNSRVWSQAYATKCTQCHAQVHGSDLPSQTVPGQGRSLTR
jgi:DmsE family decaheme c-type cytochrome